MVVCVYVCMCVKCKHVGAGSCIRVHDVIPISTDVSIPEVDLVLLVQSVLYITARIAVDTMI